MATKTDIANFALGLLGEFQISSLTESTKQARLCNRFIDQCIREELRTLQPNTAKRRKTLNQLTETPDFEYAYYYQLPVDFLRMVRVNDGIERDRYTIEGDRLLSNDSNIDIIYISDPLADETTGGVGKLDTSTIECIYYKLAIKIAIPLADDEALRAKVERYYITEARPNAGYIDSTEQDERIYDDSLWINSRVSSTNG